LRKTPLFGDGGLSLCDEKDSNLSLDVTINSRSESDITVKCADVYGGAEDIRAASDLVTRRFCVISPEIMMTAKNF
jgi:hypothetical protein